MILTDIGNMSTLDIILLVLFIPGAIRGLSKGLLEQVISLGGILLSVYAAYHFSQPVCNWIAQYIQVSDTVLRILGFAVLLIAVLILVMLVAKLITKAIEMASLGWINRLLGLVFSLAVSALILGLLAILFDTLNEKFELVQQSVLDDSFLYGPLKDLGYWVFPYLKELASLAAPAV